MLFLNSILLAGLAGVLIPIILHLVRRQAAKPMDWGAMRFLIDTVAMRRWRMEWEDLLLMATRCLLLALIAIAIARPFVPPSSSVPWLVVIPLVLLGIITVAGSFVLSNLKTKWTIRLLGLLCLLLAATAVVMEHRLNLKRFKLAGSRDVAIIIDASTSMSLSGNHQNGSTFDQAIEEARQIVKQAPRGTAFSIILGGPAPELKTATPLTHRADVLHVLDQLQPVGGPFRAQDAIALATLNLAEGVNGSKEILLLSDGQRIGWRADNPSSWSSLGEAIESMPQKPRLLMRQFSPPPILRNIAISQIDLSRDVIGTERPVSLRVTLENTGTETITPGQLELSIDDHPLEPQGVGQLLPGQQETLEFRHQFSKSGPQAIIAHLDVNDAIPHDNQFERVVLVRDTLPVLLVDGQPSGSFLERAAGFTALALTPKSALASRLERSNQGPDENTKGFLMKLHVIAAPDISTLESFPEHGVIVLADVPKLPATIAQKIESFVSRGGGLLILTGPRVAPSFYNAWQGSEGPILPGVISDLHALPKPISPASDTFDHPSLQLFSKASRSDLNQALISQYRQLIPTASNQDENTASMPRVIARYNNGDPWLTSKDYGQGRVMLATSRWDSSSGNLPSKESFVPLVHETITWLAGSSEVSLNLPASWSPSIQLPGGSGLIAELFSGKSKPLTRIDPMIDHDSSSLASSSIRWTGRIAPPTPGEYTIEIHARGRYSLEIDDQTIIKNSQNSQSSAKVILSDPSPIMLKFSKTQNTPYLRLFWTLPNGQRSLVPASSLLPPRDPEYGTDLVLDETDATDPLGRLRTSKLTLSRRGRTLSITGPAIPGLYQLQTPKLAAEALHTQPNQKIPFVVTRDIRESRYTSLSTDDIAVVQKQLEIVQLRNHDDALAVLHGKGFGEELWKLFAIAAFILLLVEVAISRWISRSRRAGEEVHIDFEIKDAFQDTLVHPFQSNKGATAATKEGDLR